MLFLAPAPVIVRVGDLDLKAVSQDWGEATRDKSVEGHALAVGGQDFAFGIGTHAGSTLTISLKGKALRFTTRVGVDDETKGQGSIAFHVLADGKARFDSGPMHGGDAPKAVSVDLTGVNRLTLTVDDAGDGITYDHADWGEAAIETSDRRAVRSVGAAAYNGPAPDLAPVDRATTRINGPALLGGTPGRPFLYRIPASGTRPLRFSADRLPTGLTLDPKTGFVSGMLPPEGRYLFTFRVEGSGGKTTRAMRLISGERPLPTPLLGWNSWYAHFLEVDAAGVRRAARAMAASGLADFGFRYIDIDDGWEAGARNADGTIRANRKFPDMKGLADEVHGLGLRMGIYSSPGPKTCGGYLGSYGHEGQDARTYSEWGIDLLKYDWCSYGGIAKDGSIGELQKPYRLMQAELAREVNRDIALSLCQYGMGDVRTWGAEVGGSLWRTTGDVTDTWSSMAANGFENGGVGGQRGDDPDMLMVGILRTTGTARPSRLTQHEQVTQTTLWSLRGAPLLLSCDLTRLDSFTQKLLMNPEVLDVDQDLSSPAIKIAGEGLTEVWRRNLDDGTYAIGVFNRSAEGAKVSLAPVAWLPPSLVAYKSIHVRDLWSRRDLRRPMGTLTIAPHGARLFRVTAR